MADQTNDEKTKTVVEVERDLVPTPVFAAVPHSGTAPAAVVTPSSSRAAAADPKAITTPRILDQPGTSADELSEPDRSLCDNLWMVDVGKQTVGFGTGPARGRQPQGEAEPSRFQFRPFGLTAEPEDIKELEDKRAPMVKLLVDIFTCPIRIDKKLLRSVRNMTNPYASYSHADLNMFPDSGLGSTRPGGRSSQSQEPISGLDIVGDMEVEQPRIQNAEMKAKFQELQKVLVAGNDRENARLLFLVKEICELREVNEVLGAAVSRKYGKLSDYKDNPVDVELEKIIKDYGMPNSPLSSCPLNSYHDMTYNDQMAMKFELADQCKNELAFLVKKVKEIRNKNRTGGPGENTEWNYFAGLDGIISWNCEPLNNPVLDPDANASVCISIVSHVFGGASISLAPAFNL